MSQSKANRGRPEFLGTNRNHPVGVGPEQGAARGGEAAIGWRTLAFGDILVAMANNGADLRSNYTRRAFLGAVAVTPFAQPSRAQVGSGRLDFGR